MSKRIAIFKLIPAFTVLFVIFFDATPAPWGIISFLFPSNPILFVFVWISLKPKIMPPTVVFCLSIIANAYSPYSMGTESAIWLTMFISIEFLKIIFIEPTFVIYWIWWCLVVVVRFILLLIIARVHFGVLTIDARAVAHVMFSILDFPLVFYICSRLSKVFLHRIKHSRP